MNDRALSVVIGDARGRNARPAGSVTVPERSLGMPLWSFFAGAFSPQGFVYAQSYSNNGLRGHVLATVVPLH